MYPLTSKKKAKQPKKPPPRTKETRGTSAGCGGRKGLAAGGRSWSAWSSFRDPILRRDPWSRVRTACCSGTQAKPGTSGDGGAWFALSPFEEIIFTLHVSMRCGDWWEGNGAEQGAVVRGGRAVAGALAARPEENKPGLFGCENSFLWASSPRAAKNNSGGCLQVKVAFVTTQTWRACSCNSRCLRSFLWGARCEC